MYKLFLDGITGVGWDSFPSGTTTAVFAQATLTTLHNTKTDGGFFYLLMTILVGYSGIYLGQFFFAGAVLGTCTCVVVYAFVRFKDGLFTKKRPFVNQLQSCSYSPVLTGN